VLLVRPGVPGAGAQADQQGEGDDAEADVHPPPFSFGPQSCTLGSGDCLRLCHFALGPCCVMTAAPADLLGELARRPLLRGASAPRRWSASSRAAVPRGHGAHCEPPDRMAGAERSKQGLRSRGSAPSRKSPFAAVTCSPFARPVTGVTQNASHYSRRSGATEAELTPQGPPGGRLACT
jgi:hypothetical protein